MKINLKVKSISVVLLTFLLSINNFAAIVSDNDGSTFITKAEFNALKNSFNTQIDDYNKSIDRKIDGAIASYLAGIALAKTVTLKSELNQVKAQSEIGNDYKFGKSWSITASNNPEGVSHGVLFQAYGHNTKSQGVMPVADSINGIFQVVDVRSRGRGVVVLQPCKSNDTLTFKNGNNYEMSVVRVGGTTYHKFYSRILYSIAYKWRCDGSYYRWVESLPDPLPADADLSVVWETDENLKYDGMDANNQLYWDQCVKNISLGGTSADGKIWYSIQVTPNAWLGTNMFTARERSYYDITSQTTINTIGYCVDTLSGTLYYLNNDQWNYAWWDDTSTVGTNGFGTQYATKPSGVNYDEGLQLALNSWNTMRTSSTVFYNYPIYRHKTSTITADNIINGAAQGSATTQEPTYYYSGLPVVYVSDKGTIELKLKATATQKNGSAVASGTTWSGKLYLSDSRFQKNTTTSHVNTDENTLYTGYWTFNNSNTEQTISLYVPKDKEIWLKYVPDSTSADILVEFVTDSDEIIEKVDA